MAAKFSKSFVSWLPVALAHGADLDVLVDVFLQAWPPVRSNNIPLSVASSQVSVVRRCMHLIQDFLT